MGKNKALVLGLIVALLISVVLISGCVPAGGGEPAAEGSQWTWIIFLVLIFAMFYFLMIRPQRKKQKEHQQLVEQLNRGDKVVTAGGIYGVIESTSEDSIVIKVESGATMRVARGSVALKRE
jgi:preprotein translocase subunit YajC